MFGRQSCRIYIALRTGKKGKVCCVDRDAEQQLLFALPALDQDTKVSVALFDSIHNLFRTISANVTHADPCTRANTVDDIHKETGRGAGSLFPVRDRTVITAY